MKHTKILSILSGAVMTTSVVVAATSCSCGNNDTERIKATITTDANLTYVDPSIELGKSFVVDFTAKDGFEVDPSQVKIIIGNKPLQLDTHFVVIENRVVVHGDVVKSKDIKIDVKSRVLTIKYEVSHVEGEHIIVDLKGANKAVKGQNYTFNVKTKNEWYGLDYDNLIFTINGNYAQKNWFDIDSSTGDVTIPAQYITGDIVMYIPEIAYINTITPTSTKKINIPDASITEMQLTCVAKDYDGNIIENPNLCWTTTNGDSSVRLSSTGYIIVYNTATAGNMTITIKSKDDKGYGVTYNLLLNKPQACNFNVVSEGTHITVTPNGSPRTGLEYTFKVEPKEGYEIKDWSIKTGDTDLEYGKDWTYDETGKTVTIFEHKITGDVTFTVSEKVIPWTIEITGDDSILSGETKTYTATVKDADGNAISNPEGLTWSFDGEISSEIATINNGSLKVAEGIDTTQSVPIKVVCGPKAVITKNIYIYPSWKVEIIVEDTVWPQYWTLQKSVLFIERSATQFTISFKKNGEWEPTGNNYDSEKIITKFNSKTLTNIWEFNQYNVQTISTAIDLAEVSTTNITVTIQAVEKYNIVTSQSSDITDVTFIVKDPGSSPLSPVEQKTIKEGSTSLTISTTEDLAGITPHGSIKYTIYEINSDGETIRTIQTGTRTYDTESHFETWDCDVSLDEPLKFASPDNKLSVYIKKLSD